MDDLACVTTSQKKTPTLQLFTSDLFYLFQMKIHPLLLVKSSEDIFNTINHF